MICDNCAQQFVQKVVTQRHCSPECRVTYSGRQMSRGQTLVELAMLWRLSREGSYLTEICRLVDTWLKQDEKRLGSEKQARRVYEARQRRKAGRLFSVDR